MKKFIILLMIAVVGYVFYPSIAPAIMNMAGLKPHEKQENQDPVVKVHPVPGNKLPIEKPKDTIVNIPSQIFPKDQPRPDLIPDDGEPRGNETDEPDTPDEPDVVLSEADFKRIIIKAVESGKYIPFKQDNIIEWSLKEQRFTQVNDHYEGEISVEVGDLFGKHLRRAQLYIEDESIMKWEWLETKDK